jgi:hypothetical protein
MDGNVCPAPPRSNDALDTSRRSLRVLVLPYSLNEPSGGLEKLVSLGVPELVAVDLLPPP